MNTLSYGLLSMLSHSSFSGYDLMLKIQPFWPAKHSQIYPLLANLVKEEFVRYELVAQSDRPDKKVYSINEKGKAALKQWLDEPAADPVTRDELLLKTFCLSYAYPAAARQLFVNRLTYYRNKTEVYADKARQLQIRAGWSDGQIPSPAEPLFGAYILLEKAQRNTRSNLEWCEWVLSLLPE